MKPLKITVVEPLCEGVEHSRFNTLFVSSLALASGADAEIEFWGEAEHCVHVANQLGENVRSRIRFRPFLFASRLSNRKGRALAFLLTAIIRALPQARKVIFLSVNTPVIYASVLFRSAGQKRCIIHSYFPNFLDLLARWKASPGSVLFLKLVLERSVFISLREDTIADAIAAWKQVKIAHIEHPVGPARPRSQPMPGKTIVGFLGRGTPEKGFDLFESIAMKFQSPNVTFRHIGPTPVTSKLSDKPSAPLRMPLSDIEFEEQIRGLSFVFFANKRESYRFIASGVVFDAIENCVPIVGIRDSYIEYLETKYSPIGYFFNTPKELEEGMAALIASSSHRLPFLGRNLLDACEFDAPIYLQRLATVMELGQDSGNL